MNLIMLSAMYENGGNTFHRHLDGHPELYVWPFESQLGTKYVNDELLSMFPFKYRWPVFPLENEPAGDFELFFDEETKTRLRRPSGSKFRDADLEMDEKERKKLFIKIMSEKSRTTGNLVMSYFEATFSAWKNYKKSGREKFYTGYSPIIGVDAEKIFSHVPGSFIIHIVRHPCACYSETKHRPYPLSLERYIWLWTFVQHRSLVYRDKYPRNYIIIKYEDLIENKIETMKKLCASTGIEYNEILLYPSWNGIKLDNQYPWGTIGLPDLKEQEERIKELSSEEKNNIKMISKYMAEKFNYNL